MSADDRTAITRKSTRVFGQSFTIYEDDRTITGARLPSCRQVLRCALYHLKEAAQCKRPGSTGATPRYSTAKTVFQQILTFYQKANIPVVSEQTAIHKILQLVDADKKLRAIPKARRECAATRARITEHEEKLNTTFKIWPSNAVECMNDREDIAFLKSMETDRIATFGSFDQKLADRISRKKIRLSAQQERRRKANESLLRSFSTDATVRLSASSDDNSSPSGASTPDKEDSSTSVTSSRGRIFSSLNVPYNILRHRKIVSTATRLKMTPTQTATFTQALIKESGGDPYNVAASYSTADRARREISATIAADIREKWEPGKLLTLHWDTKLTATLTDHRRTEERLAVVVGDDKHVKLLGVPSYKKASNQRAGTVIAYKTLELLQKWKCEDQIVNMTFDTTAANTGHVTAACIAIQSKLQRPLLWSSCRHHVGEVIVANVFEDIHIETSKSPDVSLFVRLRENWDLLPHNSSNSDHFRPCDHSDEARVVLNRLKEETVACVNRVKMFIRHDYQELVQLTLAYFGGESAVINYNRPGAVHKARWMAKLIYMIKLALSESAIANLPPGTITTRQQTPRIRTFATFITHVYVRWWMTCSSAVDAPWNDLQLLHRLEEYKHIDKSIAESAMRTAKRHLWYLTQEMIPLSLFSDTVPSTERQKLSEALLDNKPEETVSKPQNRYGWSEGKPRFPEVKVTTSLVDLIGLDSWFFFSVLQLDAGFLSEPVADWDFSPAFLASKENICSINVVNDCAERGIKLSSDFVGTARTDDHFQNVLQVVEQDRKCNPNLRKRKLSV